MRVAEALGASELIARVRLWWYPWTLRSIQEWAGFVLCALGTRLLERARAPKLPSGAKLNVVIRDEWESRQPVEAMRTADGVVVFAGSRFLRIRR